MILPNSALKPLIKHIQDKPYITTFDYYYAFDSSEYYVVKNKYWIIEHIGSSNHIPQ